MATIEAAVRSALLTMDAVTAIVGTGNDARISTTIIDENDPLPAIVIEVDGETPQNSIDGLGGLVYADVNLLSRSTSPSNARALAEAIRVNGTDPGTGLAGWHGTAGGLLFDAVLEDSSLTQEDKEDGSQRGWWDVNQSFVMSYNEVV